MKQRIPLFENFNPEEITGITNAESLTDMSHFGVVYRGSVLNEKPGIYGISHLTEHLVCKAIDHLQDTFDADGIDWNAYTTGTYIYFYMTGLDEYINKYKSEFLKCLLNFKITKEEFENEKKIVLEEYGDSFNRQSSAHFLNVLRKTYNNYSAIGLRKDLEDLTYEMMLEFVAKQYAKPHQIINISKHNRFTQKVDLSTNVPSTKYVKGTYDAPVEEGNEYKGKSSIMNFSDLITEDIAYVNFICSMLGRGLNSPLYKEIREKRGLVYSIGCSFQELTYTEGLVIINAESSTKNIDEFQTTLEMVLKNPDTYMTKERFDIVKKSYVIKFKKQEINRYDNFEKFIDEPSTRVETIISDITLEKVLDVYKKYFNFDNFHKSIDTEELKK
ncbi:MAG: insulinase family protein [Candidatus Pacearchaeota archaeon]|jgi:predicted Zn-dependent peptidase|nr:insulinase family protein [Clostridia bacterium]